MKRILATLTILTLLACSFLAVGSSVYIETLEVGTLTGSTFTGLVIGTDVQAWDADLDIFALLTPTANAQTLLESTNFLSMTQDLSVEIGVDTQAWDADLDALAGLTSAANTIPYFTGAGTAGAITSSANVVTMLASADFAAVVTNLSLTIGTDTQAYDADLDALAGLTGAANTLPYFTGVGAMDVITSSANMVALLGSATYLAATQALDVEIGVDTQAYDADLDTYAGLTPSATAQIALVSAADSIVLNHRDRVTVAEINAGHEVLPAVTGLSYRIINCVAIAYGGAIGTTTTVDLLGTQSAGGVKIAAFAQASLTQSAVTSMLVAAGCAVLADAASWIEMDVTTAITVGKTGADADTATGVDFIITYVLE